jgi:hypothetical protein
MENQVRSMSVYWGIGQNANIREDNKLFENVVGF